MPVADARRMRRALAALGFEMLIVRRDGAGLVAEELRPGVAGLRPLAVVWDDDQAVVQARLRRAIGRLGEHPQKDG